MYYIIECDTNMTVKARFSLCRGAGTYGYIHGYLIDWTPPIFGRYINPIPINWKGRLGFLPINIFDIPMPLPCIQYSVWPKPGFGIGNQNRGLISVSEPNFFFFLKPKLFFSIFILKVQFFFIFPTSWGDTSFYKLENKPRSSKII